MLTILKNVLVVIVNWNGKKDILECLDSFEKIDYPKNLYRIMVVDNGSSDGSQAAVSQRFKQVTLLENSKNVGYVNAVNMGVRYGLDHGFDYIWVLNNDVVVKEDSLRKMVEAGELDSSIGVIAPVVCSYREPGKVDNVGYKINFWTGSLKKLDFGIDIFQDQESEIEDVETIIGCSNLTKAKVFESIGIFNPVYKIYFEETDFNVRAKKNGFRIVVARKAIVHHKNAATMNKFIFRRAYLLLRNLFLFQMLNAELRHLIVFIPYYFFIHIPYFICYGSVYGIRVKLGYLKKKGSSDDCS